MATTNTTGPSALNWADTPEDGPPPAKVGRTCTLYSQQAVPITRELLAALRGLDPVPMTPADALFDEIREFLASGPPQGHVLVSTPDDPAFPAKCLLFRPCGAESAWMMVTDEMRGGLSVLVCTSMAFNSVTRLVYVDPRYSPMILTSLHKFMDAFDMFDETQEAILDFPEDGAPLQNALPGFPATGVRVPS